MKFKHLMLALAVTMMMASCGDKKEGTEATAEKEGTEATADAGTAEEAPKADAKTMVTKT